MWFLGDSVADLSHWDWAIFPVYFPRLKVVAFIILGMDFCIRFIELQTFAWREFAIRIRLEIINPPTFAGLAIPSRSGAEVFAKKGY
jgi:hypothetical protein